jgi:hypothetical protein
LCDAEERRGEWRRGAMERRGGAATQWRGEERRRGVEKRRKARHGGGRKSDNKWGHKDHLLLQKLIVNSCNQTTLGAYKSLFIRGLL